MGAYSASKGAMAILLQHLADERPRDEVCILSVHPGAILTEAAAALGLTEAPIPWDDGQEFPSTRRKSLLIHQFS
jgi:NAD(P)-dependent dehydrogenase (short-subunit alcohol dehydrogenase family)